MKDIDFDELDRAVDSVLKRKDMPVDAPPASSDDTPPSVSPSPLATPITTAPDEELMTLLSADVPEIAPVAAPVTDPVVADSSPLQTAVPVLESASAPQAPAPRSFVPPARRRGQFLDMVHPSADMTQQHNPPMQSTARKTISPMAPRVTADTIDDVMVVSDAKPEEAATPAPLILPTPIQSTEPDTMSATQPETLTAPVWPDPIEAASQDTPQPESSSKIAPPVFTEPEPAESSPGAHQAPLFSPVEATQTPFVSDAQVEKRPLGQFNSEEDGESDIAQTPTMDDAATYEDTEEPKEQTPPAQPLSPELDSNVVSVEAQEEREVPAEVDSVEASPPQPQPAATTASSAPVYSTPFGSSIPQQYPAPAVTSDSEEHSLFGDDYHQPLLTDGKKKGLSKTILIIIILLTLLAVGAAVGYFAYTSGV